MSEENIMAVSSRLLHGKDDRKNQEMKLVWEYHRNNYQSILINLRPLFMEIDFDSDGDLDNLFKAIRFLKSIFKKKTALKIAL